ncbi:putative serine/threonine-protein kinase PBL28 [Heracleum sosnowskyi]|uniref:Serine/threonine-protein kinase PBL28 n=1 Tax=Heracleum sosnowskyi TaxID=360622 RepID=A0AAD8HQV2_9APIA|nr:putative serine/threonine-protein kinase PBL28 [Heracleum sosnowskyi]
MAEVVVGLESALTLQEKSTHYSLEEIIPDEDVQQSSKLKCFTFDDLSVATRKFHCDNVVGKGTYGRIFKGWVAETTGAPSKWGTGLVVAVMRLNRRIKSHEAWQKKICLKKEHRLLVYEFMPQGSLDKHVFRRDSYFQPLSWRIRISIALGAAKGLAYLHSPEANVIYRDFRTANILIDSYYNAKLSGFQLAKEGPEHERTHVSADINGTVCYIAPEYMATGHLTKKSDVYGFGVVLREILTGQSVFELLRAREEGLVSWTKSCLTREPTILDVVDADFQGQYSMEAALRASALALKCLSVDPKSRPDANQVVKELEQLQDL